VRVARPVVTEAPVAENSALTLMLGEHEIGHSAPGAALVALKSEPRKLG
jgi:hypothetical protein